MVPWHWNYYRSWLGWVLLSGKERSLNPQNPQDPCWESLGSWFMKFLGDLGRTEKAQWRTRSVAEVQRYWMLWTGSFLLGERWWGWWYSGESHKGLYLRSVTTNSSPLSLSNSIKVGLWRAIEHFATYPNTKHRVPGLIKMEDACDPVSSQTTEVGGWRMAKVIKLVFMSDLWAFFLLENWLNPHVWIPLLFSTPWKFRYLRHVCCILGFSINLSKATCHRKEMFLWSLDDFNFPVSDCPMFFEEQTLRELFGVS